MPQLIAVGNEGGTAIKMQLNARSIIIFTEEPFFSRIGSKIANPVIAIRPIMKTNFMPSL
jgi:hypothetical protein